MESPALYKCTRKQEIDLSLICFDLMMEGLWREMIHSISKYRELDYWMQLLQEEDPGKLEVAKSNLRKAAHHLQKRAEVIDSGSFRESLKARIIP